MVQIKIVTGTKKNPPMPENTQIWLDGKKLTYGFNKFWMVGSAEDGYVNYGFSLNTNKGFMTSLKYRCKYLLYKMKRCFK